MKNITLTGLLIFSSVSFANEGVLKTFVEKNLTSVDQSGDIQNPIGVTLKKVKECLYTGKGWNQKPLGFCTVSGYLDCENCSTEFGVTIYEKPNDNNSYFIVVPMTGEDYQ